MSNNCPAWLPPSGSKQCLQPTECGNFCFNRIKKDLELIAELKETVESAYLPNSDDTETWDSDSTSELLEAIEKIKTVLESENGLQDKLEQWNNFSEEKDYG